MLSWKKLAKQHVISEFFTSFSSVALSLVSLTAYKTYRRAEIGRRVQRQFWGEEEKVTACTKLTPLKDWGK